MVPGRVYRRAELETVTHSVDRDLKILVDRETIRKLAPGLYERPVESPFGLTPPTENELVRAFLKTNDFLVTSYNYFSQLGVGLTQVYTTWIVYNHKRSGNHTLGGRRFEFRLTPSFPRTITLEFLFVDLLNNLRRLPDKPIFVMKSLKHLVSKMNSNAFEETMSLYGRPAAQNIYRNLQHGNA